MPPNDPHRPAQPIDAVIGPDGACHVLVLARPGFVGDYVADGLRRAGLIVAGPVATASALDEAPGCAGAVIDIELDGRDLFPAVERLSAAGVPFVLIGGSTARVPVLLRDWPALIQPFAAYQVVEHLHAAGVVLPDRSEPELVIERL